MLRLLIPLFVCLVLGAPTMLLAQDAQNISLPPGPFKYLPHQVNATPDMMCNFAGTFTLQQFIGESNDTDLPQIFLCAGDSFLIRHNGDAVLTGDPNGATPPGVAFAFYACPPTIMGDNLQSIGTVPGPGDPCVLQVPPPVNGLYVTPGTPNGGDTWFFNNGGNIATFGLGQPVSIFFAPITVDEINGSAGYESAVVGAPPGPCVNVNTAAAFEVVYLNPIAPQGVFTNFGDDCLGKFTIRGGYPEYNTSALYTISIVLTSNPSVKAVIHTQQSQLFHNAPVIFSVSQAGNYTITVEDGKSCPATFTMDMSGCDPSDNVVLAFPDTIAPPATTHFCVPLTVANFEIVSSSFSVNWDPNVLQYTGIENLNPILDPFTGSTLNNFNANLGQLGFLIYDLDVLGNVLIVPDGDALFNVCFDVVGALGQCTGLNITNNPTAVGFEDETGQVIALTADTGSVCIQYLPLDLQIAIIDTTCIGFATIVVTPTGGSSPYSVTIDELPSGPTNSGVVNGSGSSYTLVDGVGDNTGMPITYSVCVADSNGLGTPVCDTIVVQILTLGAQIDFVKQPSCFGSDDGILNAIVLLGGVAVPNPGPNYTYTWTPSTVPNPTGALQDGMVNGGVKAGPYTLVITDTERNCSFQASGSLGQPPPISEDMITLTPASCSGVANGSINYLVEGGVPFAGGQYQFVWEDANGPVGAPGMNNPIILNSLTSGTYSVTVTDANGCTDTNTVTIDDLRTVSFNIPTILKPTCFGLSDGGAQVGITESSPSGNNFTFTWTPAVPGAMQMDFNLASTYSKIPAGSYFVTGQDVAGCKDTITVLVTQPAELVVSLNQLQQPGCAQQNSGSINVIAQGGTGGPNYTYTWDIPGSTPGPNQNMLSVGMYHVTVSDINGCTDTMGFTLVPPAAVPLTIDSIPARCGDDGILIAVAPTALVYKWTQVPNIPAIGSNDTLSMLGTGTYAVQVTDAIGCTAADTVTIQGVTPLSFADTSFVQPLCFGQNNGIIGVTVQDGKPPYVQYDWNPHPMSGPTNFPVPAGVYNLTVTDNVGCTLTGSFTLTQPPQVVNTLSGIQDVTCFGLCDGTAQVATNYATTPPTTGNFIYLWSDGMSTSGMRNDLCEGMYIVTSADNNSCGDTDTLFIGSPPEVTGVTNSFPTTCFGLSNGSVSVSGNGGNGAPFTYKWSDPSGSTSPIVSNLPAGNYTVTITDANGCTGRDTVSIAQPAEIMVIQDNTQTTDPNCFGGSDGFLVVGVNGGNNGNLNFDWLNAAGTVISHDSSSVDSLSSGVYSVVVTDSEGCTGSLEDMVLQDPPPVLGSYEDPDALLCHGDVTTLRIDNIGGGSGGPYQFSLDYGALLDVDFPVSLTGGEHYITYYDVNGCFYTDTITVPEPAEITVEFEPAVDEIELGDTTYQLKPLITGAAVESFTWTPAELLHWPDTLNPYVYTFESQTYTLVVFDEKGCSGTGSVTINVDPNRNVYVPNVFMPGVGRLNDHFNVYVGRGIDIVNYMRVYDRWGELMYSREKFLPNNDSSADGWDGKFNGDYVDPAVFVYIIEVKFLDGRTLLYRGDVTVVR